jgi:hypothetical protein
MLPPSSKMANLNLRDKASSSIEPFPLSLKLHSSPPSNDHSPETSGHSSPSASSSTFNSMSAGNYSGGGGDSIISVAWIYSLVEFWSLGFVNWGQSWKYTQGKKRNKKYILFN